MIVLEVQIFCLYIDMDNQENKILLYIVILFKRGKKMKYFRVYYFVKLVVRVVMNFCMLKFSLYVE